MTGENGDPLPDWHVEPRPNPWADPPPPEWPLPAGCELGEN